MISALIQLEIIVSACTLLAMVFLLKDGACGRLHCCFRWLSRSMSSGFCVLLIGVVALISSAGLAYFFGIPVPRFHDEFSYLLLSDTLSRGRLANPTHPLWIHFESFHILQQPTYASKFPPGQGLFLAAGTFISGYPIVGVWISVSLACASICWMLQAWMPKRWAFFGALLGIMQVRFVNLPVLPGGVLGYWSQSYWGGSVAALGGALVFGALPRIIRNPRVHHALTFALGLAILANTRPFEGLVISAPAMVLLAIWMIRQRKFPFKIILPITVVLVFTAGAMSFYNFRVTGNPFRFPHLVHGEKYMIAPLFVFQRTTPAKIYNHKVIRDFHTGWELSPYERQQTIHGLLVENGLKLENLWGFYLGPVLTVPLIMTFPFLWRKKWMRFVLAVCGLLIMEILTVNWFYPHHAAPITGLVLLLVVQSLRYLRNWRWRGLRLGRRIVYAIPCTLVVSNLVFLTLRMEHPVADWSVSRSQILAQLKRQDGNHLVVVRYGDHRPSYLRDHAEWVYNEADIDRARVVWAREMDAQHNRKLLEYFHERHAWLLVIDGNSSIKLVPYPSARRR
jgi:hypothetical protein